MRVLVWGKLWWEVQWSLSELWQKVERCWKENGNLSEVLASTQEVGRFSEFELVVAGIWVKFEWVVIRSSVKFEGDVFWSWVELEWNGNFEWSLSELWWEDEVQFEGVEVGSWVSYNRVLANCGKLSRVWVVTCSWAKFEWVVAVESWVEQVVVCKWALVRTEPGNQSASHRSPPHDRIRRPYHIDLRQCLLCLSTVFGWDLSSGTIRLL